MKVIQGMCWPHPVLSPPEFNDDYSEAEFQVDVNCRQAKGGMAVSVVADFELSQPDLLALVHEQVAAYVLLIKSSKTHYRKEFTSFAPRISEEFIGEVSGRVEILSFLVSVKKHRGFFSNNWNPDFRDFTFDLEVGTILAFDWPKDYWVDAVDERPITAIIELKPTKQANGHWTCNFDNDRVQVMLSESDHIRARNAREKLKNSPEGQYFMNGIYLPVLIHLLSFADSSGQSYQDFRWYSSLNDRLEKAGCKTIGASGADRAHDAQRLLDFPFAKMPFMDN